MQIATTLTIRASGTLATEPEISGVIEVIAIQESRMASRSRMEIDDLQQEIRLACVKALNKFDPSRIGPSPYAFLRRCAKNHLFNLNRGTFVPNNPPCVRCSLWDSGNRTCSVAEEGCTKIVEYRKNMAAKAALKFPEHLGYYDALESRSSSVDAFILDSSIRQTLPSGLHGDYDKMLSGRTNEVGNKNRLLIRKIVRDLIDDG